MPRQNGFLKVEGTLGDVSFYKNKEGFFMRAKGGVSKERIQNDPAFKRTRENGTEFATIAQAGKMIRTANAVLVRRAYDPSLNRRMMQVMARVKNADPVSVRGKRNIVDGMATDLGKSQFRGFDFNGNSPLRSVFLAPYVLDFASGKLTITDLIPLEMVDAPPHATHCTLQTAFLHVDFETQLSEVTYSAAESLPLNMTAVTLNLQPSAVPAATGTLFYLFLVEFAQEINGTLYALNNGNFNSLSVLELA